MYQVGTKSRFMIKVDYQVSSLVRPRSSCGRFFGDGIRVKVMLRVGVEVKVRSGLGLGQGFGKRLFRFRNIVAADQSDHSASLAPKLLV
ncbi:hypothetical protein H5410_020016 [Solanum commersonii]|uniref:Uncharacterized protein n=1 Tax=Solanum commersonii TaxID=4109 RepID=A0A9J5ZA00_SOLCO|nr:hypothetical protein H5410_020016 [Solanum commersonii]